MMLEPEPDWKRVGQVDPTALEDVRLQLHWAAQLLAAFGQNLVESRADDSHRSLTWVDSGPAGFSSEASESLDGAVVVLLTDDFTIRVRRADRDLDGFGLSGLTLDEAYGELMSLLRSVGAQQTTFDRPEYEMPVHPVGEGASFASDLGDGLAELGRWFGNAQSCLEWVRSWNPGGSIVRCWPHHFDIATLLVIDAEVNPEEARSVGVGLSPGDGGYSEPYWYITPWPYPADPDFPELAGGGEWHAHGWTGAVLTGSRIAAAGDEADQIQAVTAFLRSGIRGAKSLIGAS